MQEGKDSFILYTEQKEIFENLTDEQAGQLIKQIFNYSITGKEPCLDSLLKIAFIPIRQNIDRNTEKWQEIKQKRSEAGKAGAEIKKQKQANEANANFAKDETTNQAVNDNVNVNENNIYSPSSDEQDTPLKELSDNFNKLWDIYPRKERKNTAFNHYKTWINGKKYSGETKRLTNRQMWYAIQIYNYDIFKDKTEKNFIKMGSTFFNEAIYEYASRYIENVDYWEKEIARWQRNE